MKRAFRADDVAAGNTPGALPAGWYKMRLQRAPEHRRQLMESADQTLRLPASRQQVGRGCFSPVRFVAYRQPNGCIPHPQKLAIPAPSPALL